MKRITKPKRNAELAEHLRTRKPGKHDPRPRKQRTRADSRKHAIHDSIRSY